MIGLDAALQSPHHEEWGFPMFPEKIKAFRDAQVQAIREITERFEAGAKVVVLEAPTGCLAGDTLIDCPRDLTRYPRGIPIQDLVGQEFLTYSWDQTAKSMVIRLANDVRSTGVKPVVRVKLAPAVGWRQTSPEQDTEVRRLHFQEGLRYVQVARRLGLKKETVRAICLHPDRGNGTFGRHQVEYPKYWAPMELTGTADHRVMLSDGTWKPLGSLSPGDRLLSLYRMEDERTHIRWTGSQKKVSEQQFVCEQMYGPRPDGAHAHHKNEISYDHTPANLEWKDGRKHAADHLADANRRGTRGWKKTGDHPRGMAGKRHSPEALAKISAGTRGKKLRLTEEERERRRQRMRALRSTNHVVVADPEPLGTHPVYDMAVDGTENFVANGVVVHNSGKTLLGEAVRRALQVRGLYMCIDRGLQDQFVHDYDYASVLKGRRNYPTLDYPDRFNPPEHLSCDDCDGGPQTGCSWCSSRKACPYGVAKRSAKAADLACVNTAYFLAECNTVGEFSGWPLVIADEGDRLEGTLMSYVEVTIGERRLLEWGARPPHAHASVQEICAWLGSEILPRVAEDIEALGPDPTGVRDRRRRRALVNLQDRLDNLLDDLPAGGWVMEIRRNAVTFKPVKVDAMAPKLLWAHADRWLVMSATVLNPARMLRDLGVTEDWAVVRMPSSFPVENRPIIARNVVDVTFKNEEAAIPLLVEELRRIFAQHATERILVHCVSYRLMQAFRERLEGERRAVWLEGADARAGAIEAYLAKDNGILLAPALERGVDFFDDQCRVVVIAKIPWPSLGDAQVAARLNLPDGRAWYEDLMLRSVIQMSGRGVRHETDTATTYVLDAQFKRVMGQYGNRLPAWWREAVRNG